MKKEPLMLTLSEVLSFLCAKVGLYQTLFRHPPVNDDPGRLNGIVHRTGDLLYPQGAIRCNPPNNKDESAQCFVPSDIVFRGIMFWQAMQSGPNCKKLVGRLRPQAPENQSLRSVVVSYSCVMRTASDTGALLSFWVLFPSEIFLFWQVVPFQNIKIILDQFL